MISSNSTDKRDKLSILITDGGYKHTLGIIRNLPREYVKTVISTGSKWFTLCNYSKYCSHVITIPGKDSEHSKKDSLLTILKSGKYDVLIPVGLNSCSLVYKYANEFSKYVAIMHPTWDSFIIASEKEKTMEFATSCGVPIPNTTLVENSSTLKKISQFPAVLKPAGGTGGKVFYCNSLTELEKAYKSYSEDLQKKLLCQEYIDGFGCGYFGLYANGKRLASFMHKRIKEYPISGGPSVCAESFYDERLERYGNKLCEDLHWTGPIMCEFKYDTKNDDYKLIEINPKLWGSLELTLEAGVNIPDIMINYLLKKDFKPITMYKNIRYRWILSGELKHYLESKDQTNIFKFLRRKSNEVTDIRIQDPFSTLFLAVMCIYAILRNKHSNLNKREK